MDEARRPCSALAWLQEVTGGAAFRLNPYRAVQGFAALVSDGFQARLTVHLENLRTLVDKLPPAPFIYEAWLVTAAGQAVSAGAFNAAGAGTGSAGFDLEVDDLRYSGIPLAAAGAVLITAEPFDGNPAPTTPLLHGQLLWQGEGPAPWQNEPAGVAVHPAAAPSPEASAAPPVDAAAPEPTGVVAPPPAEPEPLSVETPVPAEPEPVKAAWDPAAAASPVPAAEPAATPPTAQPPLFAADPLATAPQPQPDPTPSSPAATPTAPWASSPVWPPGPLLARAAEATGQPAAETAPAGTPTLRAQAVLTGASPLTSATQAVVQLDFSQGGLLLTLRGMPQPGRFGAASNTGREYNVYKAWLTSSRTREAVALGIMPRIWHDTYRIQVREGLTLERFDTVQVTVDDRGAPPASSGPTVLSGRYVSLVAPHR